ncbi:glycosyltransferase family 4 protein [Cellulomonas palmilytica]|uniref:glycosyltransferase family 4 protein n=1 Tax=Cellulomonas palmilytica TaxID=2608402 RepID=UPI001F1A8E6B|nr:glycosyltransferase family 4 protein [Cellulomonas palmilytica]UJP41010.1 glycosyltransferase family 4 protein [Cellulomonas palmilytica]
MSQPIEAGVANVVRDLADHQSSLGHEVAVACPDGGHLARELRSREITHLPWEATRNPGPGVLRESSALRRLVGQFAPDLVHLHSTKAGLAGRLALRGRVPTMFEPHAWGDWAASEPVATAIRVWEKIGARWTDLTICLSEAEAAHAVRLGIHRTITIPNGVDTSRFAPRDRARARRELGVDDGARVTLCVGRLAHQKGQDLLLRSWSATATDPGALLVLVGGGPDEQALRALAREIGESRVRFVTDCDDPRDWYAAADVVVAPSRWEGAALVPLEAMAMGRPVVGFDVGGLATTIGPNGAAIEPGDVNGLENALAKIDRGDARLPGASAITAYVSERHSARVAFDQITAAAARLVEEKA